MGTAGPLAPRGIRLCRRASQSVDASVAGVPTVQTDALTPLGKCCDRLAEVSSFWRP